MTSQRITNDNFLTGAFVAIFGYLLVFSGCVVEDQSKLQAEAAASQKAEVLRVLQARIDAQDARIVKLEAAKAEVPPPDDLHSVVVVPEEFKRQIAEVKSEYGELQNEQDLFQKQLAALELQNVVNCGKIDALDAWAISLVEWLNKKPTKSSCPDGTCKGAY